MLKRLQAALEWLLAPEISSDRRPGHLWPRWIFLRALGLIYFSAFYSLLFQIKGLIGPNGILPARDYLQAVAAALQAQRFWYAPTLLWFSSSDRALMLICWVGAIASLLLVLNIWPRAMLAVCFVCFLSFIGAAQDFASYQSDGMLLEAGFLSLFFAPDGFRPGLGRASPPSRASLYLLRWEWFCIYFGSGVAKMASGDPTWRNFTAMDDYYQNSPLPTWIGWYVGHFPHWFHASAVFYTLAIELVLAWLIFLPRRFRIALFFIVAPFETSIILTGNYAFLNYIVFSLGFLLLDDRFIEWIVPRKILDLIEKKPPSSASTEASSEAPPEAVPENWRARWRRYLMPVRMAIAAAGLGLIFYCTAVVQFGMRFLPSFPFPEAPLRWTEPFRIADAYGLFAVMTHARYEIEFQGSPDGGNTWIPYPFRYKPQDPREAPGIYAPYQPRFEWNLWFASLGAWPEYRFVVWTEERLLRNDKDVLELFRANPFAAAPPTQVRAVIYRYWFTDMKTKREQGIWWQRELLGDYAPSLARQPDGNITVLDTPIVEPPSP
ncbi:MAG: lipase maturation factor family protein [Candidatus Acidiferrales bacterium]